MASIPFLRWFAIRPSWSRTSILKTTFGLSVLGILLVVFWTGKKTAPPQTQKTAIETNRTPEQASSLKADGSSLPKASPDSLADSFVSNRDTQTKSDAPVAVQEKTTPPANVPETRTASDVKKDSKIGQKPDRFEPVEIPSDAQEKGPHLFQPTAILFSPWEFRHEARHTGFFLLGGKLDAAFQISPEDSHEVRLVSSTENHPQPDSSIELVGPMLETPTLPKHSPQEIPQTASSEKLEEPAPFVALTPCRPGFRSDRLESIARQADEHTRRGYDLADRKAFFSARAEFIRALRMLAQGLDLEHSSHFHSKALSQAMVALKESDDLDPQGAILEGTLNLKELVSAHQTSEFLGSTTEGALVALDLRKRYLSFAQEKLAEAVGNEVAGSMALHALGKIHASKTTIESRPNVPKAMVFYQATLIACPQNYLAMNDLGVLLARAGRPGDARRILEYAASSRPTPILWQNLAKIHRQMGNVQAAQVAEHEATTLTQMQANSKRSSKSKSPVPISWVKPDEFVRSYAQSADAREPLPVRQPVQKTKGQEAAVSKTNARSPRATFSKTLSPTAEKQNSFFQ